MSPQIIVSYFRDYYIVDNVRLTHDKKISFKPYCIDNYNTTKIVRDYLNVLEIKFDDKNLDDAKKILNIISINLKKI